MRICMLTGKRAGAGNNVSHSHRRTTRKFQPNIITTRINGQRMRIAASTLRTLKKWSREITAEKEVKAEA